MDEISGAEAELNAPGYDKGLRRRTFRSVGWTMGQAAGDQLFSFAVFVLLARVLDKQAIGTFALAFVFMDIGRNLATAGVSQRVARSQAFGARELETIFWTNFGLAGAYSLLVLILAPAAERLFGAPQLAAVLAWLTLPILMSGAANTHMALRLREFGHKTLAMRSLLGGLIGGTCAVVAALLGAGIWALVLQRIVRELVCTLLAWSSFRWRPRFAVDLAAARNYLVDALQLGFAQVVTLLSLRAQDLGIARTMGPVPLSSYRIAWRCAELIGPQIVGPFATVALQTFSRLQGHGAELKATYVALLRQCASVSVPALVGYAVAGPWLVPALFGPQWQEAGAIAPMLLPLALPFATSGFVVAFLAAQGNIGWQRHLSLLDLLSTIAVTILAVPYGLKWLALTYSLRALLFVPLQIYLVGRVSAIGPGDHVRALAAPVVAASIMGAVAALLFRLVQPVGLLTILPLCVASALLYATMLLAMVPRYREQLRKVVPLLVQRR